MGSWFLILVLFVAGCGQESGYPPTLEERKNQNICKGNLKKEIMERFDVCFEESKNNALIYNDRGGYCKRQAIEFVCPMGSLEGLNK